MASSSSPPPPPPSFSYCPEPPLGVPLLPAPPPSSRRLPPPCWTPAEISALIDAYRDKWYSLRRGNLRAVHWQEVADDVHRVCPNVSPPKTAVQCRHKMEKLRKRYRAELQRAKSIPHHRFSSSWVYFSKMESMEKGYSVFSSGGGGGGDNIISASLSPVVVADDLVNDAVDDDNNDDDDEDYSGGSFRKEMKDFQRNGLRIRIAGNSRKNYGGFDEIPNPNPDSKFGYKSFLLRYNEFGTPPQFEDGMRYATKVLKNGSNGGSGGSSSGLGMGMGKGKGKGMAMNMVMKKKSSALGKKERGRKRGDEVALAMAEAIRVLGEGFVRMEESKIEMIRVCERQRMENELRHTEMILQYQQSIVESIVKGWSDLIVNKGDDGRTNNNKDAS